MENIVSELEENFNETSGENSPFSFIHGTTGLSFLYSNLYFETNDTRLLKPASFWLNKALMMKEDEDVFFAIANLDTKKVFSQSKSEKYHTIL